MKARDIFNEDGRIVKGVNTTADVGPNEIKTQAAKFGNTVDKDGVPPTLSKKVKGASTNVAFNLGLTEGYKLQLERDKNTLVLHIKDTATGGRTEVRGKLGYETTGYDSNDPLHQLLDEIGKSANISELINGEVVTINPKHPEAEKAKAATDKAYGEDKDGVPPTLSKKVKGASTNVAFNLGLTEGFDPVGWLKSSLNPDPQYKAWKKVFKQNPAQAKKMFRSNHREYLAIYQNESISEKYNTENFADGKKKVQEAFDNPYPINWTNLQDAGGSNAKVKLDDGGILDISITEADYGYYEIEFSKGGTLKPTGEGDEFRIFATVIAAIKQWWKQLDKEEVMEIHFSAAVADGGRSKLYKRFANQWAQLIGWSMDFDEDPKTISFVLNNPQFESVAENFADGKKPGRKGLAKRSGINTKASVSSLRKTAKRSSGEKQRMAHWLANMKAGKAKKK